MESVNIIDSVCNKITTRQYIELNMCFEKCLLSSHNRKITCSNSIYSLILQCTRIQDNMKSPNMDAAVNENEPSLMLKTTYDEVTYHLIQLKINVRANTILPVMIREFSIDNEKKYDKKLKPTQISKLHP